MAIHRGMLAMPIFLISHISDEIMNLVMSGFVWNSSIVRGTEAECVLLMERWQDSFCTWRQCVLSQLGRERLQSREQSFKLAVLFLHWVQIQSWLYTKSIFCNTTMDWSASQGHYIIRGRLHHCASVYLALAQPLRELRMLFIALTAECSGHGPAFLTLLMKGSYHSLCIIILRMPNAFTLLFISK